MKFDDLEFTPHPSFDNGTRAIHQFPNGYGISVITGGYGDSGSPYEIAVIYSDGSLCYDTPITNDVIGYLSCTDVQNYLDMIEALPNRSIT